MFGRVEDIEHKINRSFVPLPIANISWFHFGLLTVSVRPAATILRLYFPHGTGKFIESNTLRTYTVSYKTPEGYASLVVFSLRSLVDIIYFWWARNEWEKERIAQEMHEFHQRSWVFLIVLTFGDECWRKIWKKMIQQS